MVHAPHMGGTTNNGNATLVYIVRCVLARFLAHRRPTCACLLLWRDADYGQRARTSHAGVDHEVHWVSLSSLPLRVRCRCCCALFDPVLGRGALLRLMLRTPSSPVGGSSQSRVRY